MCKKMYFSFFFLLHVRINIKFHKRYQNTSYAEEKENALQRAVARALIGGCIFIYSCSARLISFEINLKTTDFKRNPSGITRIII